MKLQRKYILQYLCILVLAAIGVMNIIEADYLRALTSAIYVFICVQVVVAGFAIGWLSVRAKYKAKYDYEATREFFRRKPLYEWHTSIPCPGAFLICEVEKNRLIYGYAVSDGEGVAIMQLPDRVNVFDQDVTPRIVPYSGVRRWSYAEDHPIYPSEALRPYSQSYKKIE